MNLKLPALSLISVFFLLSSCTTQRSHEINSTNSVLISDSIQQKILHLIDLDKEDHLSHEQKASFKKEVTALSQQRKKEYPKNDETARPAVVGYQLKYEEALIKQYHDKSLDNWKITVVFITPKTITPLSIDPNNRATWHGAISEEVQNDPVRLHTVLGRCTTVPQLIQLGSNVKVYSFYPESGFLKRPPLNREKYNAFVMQDKTHFINAPMKQIQELRPDEVGAIYIIQPPGTFKTSLSGLTDAENPLQVIEDEISQLQSEYGADLKNQVFITNIGAGQAIDANKANIFSLCSGPLSSPDVQGCFDLRKDTITTGITKPASKEAASD